MKRGRKNVHLLSVMLRHRSSVLCAQSWDRTIEDVKSRDKLTIINNNDIKKLGPEERVFNIAYFDRYTKVTFIAVTVLYTEK